MNSFKKFQLLLGITLFSITMLSGGYYLGISGYEVALRKNPPKIEISNKYPKNQNIDFDQFWKVWDLVNATYLERPLDNELLMQGAIKGMVEAIGDPYTTYLPPEENESVNNSINGTYEGIGAELAIRDNQLVIVAPLEGSPAEEAGVRAGDRILQIEEEGTAGLSLTEAVLKIRGKAGTLSSLLLQRGDAEPFRVTIKRGNINVDSVSWEDKGSGTAYIRISRFGGETNREWDNIVGEVTSQMTELDAIILDLRGNPGGYLQSAVHIANDFMSNKVVLYQETATGEQTAESTGSGGAFVNVPKIVVLIDQGSASASEILAAALKAQSDAILIGQKSFGKGTIQTAENFEDNSGVHITFAKWLTPEKVWVHDVGITPDETIEITDQDIESSNDTQLNRALDLANEF